jgi:hypothetical protein
MLKNISQLHHLMENKLCVFQCDNDTPLPIVKEALFQFQKYIGQIEDQVKAQQEAAKAKQEEPAPEIKE